jgi:aquaporin Z
MRVRETTGSVTTSAGAQHRPATFVEGELTRAISSLRFHWPEYLMEAGEVALYLLLTCFFATVLQDPASPVRHLINSDIVRRALMGLAVGASVIAIVMTPWGKQSGGHFNPAITVAFYRLSKVALPDTVFYVVAQFSGAIGGVCIARYLLLAATGHEVIRYAVTTPGARGNVVAFLGELTISFLLMITILVASNREALARYTPYFVGFLYAVFILFETPLSGMSMNPARSFAPALHASYSHAVWLYFAAPTLGMLVAAEVFLRARGGVRPFCAKLHHANDKRCIFQHGTAPHSAKSI